MLNNELFYSRYAFYHYQLLQPNNFAPRHFGNVDEMNQAMIDAWNSRRDEKVSLSSGDISMRPQNKPMKKRMICCVN